MREKLSTIEDAIDLVQDGATIGIAGENDMAPMALAREVIRRGRKNLLLYLVPGGGLPADMMLGAGCVRLIEASNVEVGSFGFAPHFRRRAQAGEPIILDSG